MLHQLVKNKELIRGRMGHGTGQRNQLSKYSSLDSDVSEGSTLVSTQSDSLGELAGGEYGRGGGGGRRIKHHIIRSVLSDSEMDTMSVTSVSLGLL